MALDLSIWNDSPQAVWDDLQPQQFHYPLSSMYPAIFIIVLFTIIHLMMDRWLHSYASRYAKQATNFSVPKWIKSSEYASRFTYIKLSSISPKKFAKSMKKFEFDDVLKPRELMSYQTKCVEHKKHVSKYQEASFKVLVSGFVYFYGLALLLVDGQWYVIMVRSSM